jgi:hypothetical protein
MWRVSLVAPKMVVSSFGGSLHANERKLLIFQVGRYEKPEQKPE